MPDEGDVARAAHAHHPRLRACLGDAVDHCLDDRTVLEPADRLAQRGAERGADSDHDLARRLAQPGDPGVGGGGRPLGGARGEVGRRLDVRQLLQQLPAGALEAVARARAGVDVRVVDRRDDAAIGSEDRRGLEVVGRDALALHCQDRLGDVAEARGLERERHVGTADALGEDAIAGQHVGGAVAVGQVARVLAACGKLDLLVADRREAEPGKDRLDGACGAQAHRQQLLLACRLDAGVDLPVALQRQPLIVVVGVVVAAAEHVVVARHRAVARRHEVGAGQELPHQLARLADRRLRGDRVVARRHLEVEPGREHVLGQDLARAAGQRQHQSDAGDRAVLHAL